MIDFNRYKENISVEAFVSIVSKDILKELTDEEKCKLKNGITFSDVHFSFGLRIRNKYIYPYLEKHRFGGKKSIDADSVSFMVAEKVIKKIGGHIDDMIVL